MTCTICNNKKLLPLKRKDGTVVPHAFVDCECKQDETNHHDISPEDFDFPMSATFREFTFETYGSPWHQRSALTNPIVTEKPVAQPWDKRQQYQIDQVRSELIHIRRKLFEITGKKLEPGKPKNPAKYTYTGLVIE